MQVLKYFRTFSACEMESQDDDSWVLVDAVPSVTAKKRSVPPSLPLPSFPPFSSSSPLSSPSSPVVVRARERRPAMGEVMRKKVVPEDSIDVEKCVLPRRSSLLGDVHPVARIRSLTPDLGWKSKRPVEADTHRVWD